MNSIHAMKADQQKPITISTDSADANLNSDNFNLSGRVSIVQGTLSIHGNKVSAKKMADGKTTLLSVYGAPASFQQLLDSKNKAGSHKLFKATAQSITYNNQTGIVTLSGNVYIQVDKDRLTGGRATFNTKKEEYYLYSNGKNRARLILYPTR
ncbi:MAG: lipopolysaccharide transport periplasmic protein LptA [Neisseriaceae bacterium]